ncbi:hypothetical protein AAY473_034437 [Plecturocebus cupreus]
MITDCIKKQQSQCVLCGPDSSDQTAGSKENKGCSECIMTHDLEDAVMEDAGSFASEERGGFAILARLVLNSTSGDLPTLASQSAGITHVSHRAQLRAVFSRYLRPRSKGDVLLPFTAFTALFVLCLVSEMAFLLDPDGGLFKYLVCKRKLESKKEALLILSKELDTCQQERDQYKLMANQLRERHQSLKKKYRELIIESPSVAQAGVQWYERSLQPLPPGFKDGFQHVGPASLKFLTSGDLPASASQITEITGENNHIWPESF